MSLTNQEIRDEVARAYGNRVRPLLEDERLPMVAIDSCCTGEAEATTEATCSCCSPSASTETSCCGVEATDDVRSRASPRCTPIRTSATSRRR